MDINKITQRIAVIVLLLIILSFSAYADSVHTYHSSFNLPIPADKNNGKSKGQMNDAIININQYHTIYDLDIGITITHTHVFDLQLILQSPTGISLVLNMYDYKTEFFFGANYTNTIFDDEALTPIEDGTVPFTGQFKPKNGNLLEIFDNEDVFGDWRLRILDEYEDDTGILDSFELIVTTPEPASAIFLVFGTILARRFRVGARKKE